MNMFSTAWQIVDFHSIDMNYKLYIYFIEVVDSITNSF